MRLPQFPVALKFFFLLDTCPYFLLYYEKLGELVCGLRGSYQLRPLLPDADNAAVGKVEEHIGKDCLPLFHSEKGLFYLEAYSGF